MAERAAGDQRMLETLERLLEIPGASLKTALESGCDLVAAALAAEKVDAFLYDPTRDTLVALGTSHQPLSVLQRKHGLDILPMANGGRAAHVFRTGETFVTGHLEEDSEELRGIKGTLAIRSQIGVPLRIGGNLRGLMMIASTQPEHFTTDDVRFADAVVRWVGVVAHRAELVEEIARNAADQGRRAVAEELVTVLAHDMRDYLSPVHLRLDLLRRRAESEGRTADANDLDLTLKSLMRADALVSDLLDVAPASTRVCSSSTYVRSKSWPSARTSRARSRLRSCR